MQNAATALELLMPRKVQITTIRQHDGLKIDMPATLEDAEVAQLELYLESLDHLLKLKVVREGVPSSFELRVEGGQITHLQSEVPRDEDVGSLLHRIRPFILNNEPANFTKVRNVLRRRFRYPGFHALLDEYPEIFTGERNQELIRITSNNTLINCDDTLFDWLNSYEYHRDQEKREKIDSLHRLMPLEHSKPIFLYLLWDKVRAIALLGQLIEVILGRQDSIETQRRMPTTDETGEVGGSQQP